METWQCKMLGDLKCHHFHPLWSNFGCRWRWLALAPLVMPRHSGRHAVCFWPCGSFCSVATPDSSCHLWHHHWSSLGPFFSRQFAPEHSGKQRVQMENLKGRQMLLFFFFSWGVLNVIKPHAPLLPYVFKHTKTFCHSEQLFSQNH